MENNQKKTRAPPRNAKQYAFMVDFMVQNKNIAQHKFGASHHDKDDINNGWNTLVEELNKRGPVKTRDSWEKTWKDSKINASKKFGNLRRQRAQTGNKPLTDEICKGLNDAERKIISILGADYNLGTDISEALPESDESLRRMMNGKGVDVENALKNEDMPIFVQGGELLVTNPPQQMETVQTNNEPSEAASTPTPSTSTTANNSLVPSASRTPSSTSIVLVSQATKRKSSTSMDRPNAKVPRCRSNREKLGAQFQEARVEFSSLQKLHVEALKVSADALMKMALNDEKRLKLEEERLHVQKEQIKVMQAVCSLVEKITQK